MKSKHARGFTILEVLVSITLIAIALLGSAALQAYSTKVTQGGQFRSQAVVLGMDIVERIEANNPGAVTGSYIGTLPASSNAPDCVVSMCSPADLAAFDLDQIEQNLVRQLPGGAVTITRTGAGPFVYTVQISWQERSYKAKATTTASQSPTETLSFTVSRTVYDKSVVI